MANVEPTSNPQTQDQRQAGQYKQPLGAESKNKGSSGTSADQDKNTGNCAPNKSAGNDSTDSNNKMNTKSDSDTSRVLRDSDRDNSRSAAK